MHGPSERDRSILFGGGVLGFGCGGLLDVLVFHFVLQWHHLLSNRYSPTTLTGLQTNVYFDGVFSLAMVGLATVGGVILWRALNRADSPYSSARLLGSVLVGAGAFNVFDAVVDHYVLHLHDVVHGSQRLNPHWLGASLLLLGVGILILTR